MDESNHKLVLLRPVTSLHDPEIGHLTSIRFTHQFTFPFTTKTPQ